MQFLQLFCFCFTWEEIGVLPKDDLYCEIPEWGVNMELQLGGLKVVGAQPPGFQPSLSSRLSVSFCQHL